MFFSRARGSFWHHSWSGRHGDRHGHHTHIVFLANVCELPLHLANTTRMLIASNSSGQADHIDATSCAVRSCELDVMNVYLFVCLYIKCVCVSPGLLCKCWRAHTFLPSLPIFWSHLSSTSILNRTDVRCTAMLSPAHIIHNIWWQ